MSDATLDHVFLILCDWRGQLVWETAKAAALQIGDHVWDHLDPPSQEKARQALARVVTLREQQQVEVRNDRGQWFRAWLWPLESPQVAVCILGIQVPQELIKLTRREKQCLQCLARGLAVKDVAEELDVSVSTVHTLLRRCREKLNLPSGEALIAFAGKHHRLLL